MEFVKRQGAMRRDSGIWEIFVWAPFRKKVELEWRFKKEEFLALSPVTGGYWFLETEARAGDQYRFVLDDDKIRPDPASRRQPDGVHEWSQLYPADDFVWRDDAWQNPPLQDYIIYELHVGTFTPEGTFAAIIPRLDALSELGITAIELMPVSSFPGNRNWGYDGVYPYGVQESYGGPDQLKELIQACHEKNLAVILDVVYNHLGPEGNYLRDFGPYFTDKYHTPWGSAVNLDDAYCEPVRAFFLDTLRQWFEEYHFDALRLDATHAIYDEGPVHFLSALREAADQIEHKTGKKYYLIAESNQNDRRLISDRRNGGYGLDGQWADDFHHAFHSFLTGEQKGYYSDFGDLEQVRSALHQPFVREGSYSEFRKKRVGSFSDDLPDWRFVVFLQNHDQVGNRMKGDRLHHLIDSDLYRMAVGLMLISSYVPLLFMGEEYGESHPFLYFVSHGDEELTEAVRKGRKMEFREFNWGGEVPDPQAENTFLQSKIQWDQRLKEDHRKLLEYYKSLIRLRKQGRFKSFGKIDTLLDGEKSLLTLRSVDPDQEGMMAIANFKSEYQSIERKDEDPKHLLFCSAEQEQGGADQIKYDGEEGEIELPARSLSIFTEENHNCNE